MNTEVKMPKLGLTMKEGTVVRWLKTEGDPVDKGEPLFEVETDKVVMEVEAPEEGVLKKILVPEGSTVAVTEPVAMMTVTGKAGAEEERPAGAAVKATPVAERVAEAHGVDLSELDGTGPRGRITASDVREALGAEKVEAEPERSRIRASWRARSLAEEYGIDLSELVPGRGPKGRVVEKDVLEAVDSLEVGRPEERAEAAEWEELSTVERVTAQRMAESFSTVPHFYLTVEAHAERMLDLRQALIPLVQERVGARLTITDILIKVAGAALREHPRVNGAWEDGRVRLSGSVNLGLATATDQGLVVPVIQHVDRKSLPEVVAERADLTTRAREGRLSVDEVGNSSFTLTNLGAYGVDQFQPIINIPESGILAVGQIKERPTGVNGELALRSTVFLTLACDHRVLDGARAAAFLQRVTELIEEPYALLAAGNLLDSGSFEQD